MKNSNGVKLKNENIKLRVFKLWKVILKCVKIYKDFVKFFLKILMSFYKTPFQCQPKKTIDMAY